MIMKSTNWNLPGHLGKNIGQPDSRSLVEEEHHLTKQEAPHADDVNIILDCCDWHISPKTMSEGRHQSTFLQA